MFVAGFLLLLAQAAEPPPPDIVVRAVRGRCELVYAGSRLDGRALQRMADGWPEGRPLRVLEPRGASRSCLAKITFELADRGFRSVEFVDPPER
ncbi:hypothetical protein [Sphingomonas jatrophae]|uniref:Uncharacterized protein n=1 Tax=Sphingomonas jatrophae TaxID=1166337 RepID=A0A1I6M6A1_9SPHN|nr:hypothetical protein [Sphingomonas jatrophae]SFS11032.1 hypothetical protein SAMN05192580_3511 [Sphingomonas jatrophae]